jgi:Methane oxygenase PmoA
MRTSESTGVNKVFLAPLLLAVILAPVPGVQAAFAFKEVNDSTGLELLENGKPVFVYNYGGVLAPGAPEASRRSCYLHPVYAPDGTVLTDDFNRDHPHHRGIFWAWEVITADGKTDDIWTVKGFRQKFVRWEGRDADRPAARLALENGWYDGERKFVKEEVEILVQPEAHNQRILDFILRFEAVDQPVVIVGTPDQSKGYGGFSFRGAPRDGGAAKTTILTDQGVLEKDGVMARHPWAEISGSFNGTPAGFRIEDHPTNPGYPKNGWLMRHGFGLLNVSYPGLEPVTLQPGKPLVLKYRVILFVGKTAMP